MKRSAVPLIDLKQLVSIVSEVRVNKMKIIGTKGSSSSKFQQMYDKLLDDEIQTEEEGEAAFYPPGSFQRQYYGDLKRGLFERLLNTLFFIDVDKPQFTEYQKANQVCYRNLLIVKLLLSYGQRHLGVMIAKKTYNKALYFDFTEVVLLLSKELRLYYSTITGEKEKAELFGGYAKKYLEIYTAELKSDEYYSELMVNYVFSKANKPELIGKAGLFCNELNILFEKVDSYRFRYMYYLVNILRYEIENDYKSILKVCEEALEYFTNQKTFGPKSVLFQFYFKMILCHIQLHQFEHANSSILTCLDLIPEGDYNWYVTRELDYLLSIRSHDYQKAYKIYLIVFNQANFESQFQPIVERWKINEAFVHFLILKGKIEPAREEIKHKFRINKFLNEVPRHSKDKRGTNITILILQILFLLEQERYEDIFERIEPLRMYTSRYLSKDDTFRGNCFIKMLMQLPAGRFHKEAVKRKAAPYLKKLESIPLDVAKQTAELEIIPYEELWEYVMESLGNKVR